MVLSKTHLGLLLMGLLLSGSLACEREAKTPPASSPSARTEGSGEFEFDGSWRGTLYPQRGEATGQAIEFALKDGELTLDERTFTMVTPEGAGRPTLCMQLRSKEVACDAFLIQAGEAGSVMFSSGFYESAKRPVAMTRVKE